MMRFGLSLSTFERSRYSFMKAPNFVMLYWKMILIAVLDLKSIFNLVFQKIIYLRKKLLCSKTIHERDGWLLQRRHSFDTRIFE